MNDKHIEMRGVRKVYRFFSLDDVSLDLEPGQIMGFVGPNGAGKSTTLRLAMGMIAPDAGEIRVLGHERALAVAGHDHPLGLEVQVGALDGDDADVQGRCKCSD